MKKPKQPDIRARSTQPFKLKDRPERQMKVIHLVKVFGFLPETIVVEKERARNNSIIVRAILTSEEMKKEDKQRKEAKEALKKSKEKMEKKK